MRLWIFVAGPDAMRAGEWYELDDEKIATWAGACHGSEHALDALAYGAGAWVALIETDGEVVAASDRCVARRRRALWLADATPTLRAWALECAAAVAPYWPAGARVRDYRDRGRGEIRGAADTAGAAAMTEAIFTAHDPRAAGRAAMAADAAAFANAADDGADVAFAAWMAAAYARVTDPHVTPADQSERLAAMLAAAHDKGHEMATVKSWSFREGERVVWWMRPGFVAYRGVVCAPITSTQVWCPEAGRKIEDRRMRVRWDGIEGTTEYALPHESIRPEEETK